MKLKIKIKGMRSKAQVVWLSQTSKAVDMLILPAVTANNKSVSANNKPVTQLIGGTNNGIFL